MNRQEMGFMETLVLGTQQCLPITNPDATTATPMLPAAPLQISIMCFLGNLDGVPYVHHEQCLDDNLMLKQTSCEMEGTYDLVGCRIYSPYQ